MKLTQDELDSLADDAAIASAHQAVKNLQIAIQQAKQHLNKPGWTEAQKANFIAYAKPKPAIPKPVIPAAERLENQKPHRAYAKRLTNEQVITLIVNLPDANTLGSYKAVSIAVKVNVKAVRRACITIGITFGRTTPNGQEARTYVCEDPQNPNPTPERS